MAVQNIFTGKYIDQGCKNRWEWRALNRERKSGKQGIARPGADAPHLHGGPGGHPPGSPGARLAPMAGCQGAPCRMGSTAHWAPRGRVS
eukprot:365381-Chlamydomonas_euryale.AAC.9